MVVVRAALLSCVKEQVPLRARPACLDASGSHWLRQCTWLFCDVPLGRRRSSFAELPAFSQRLNAVLNTRPRTADISPSKTRIGGHRAAGTGRRAQIGGLKSAVQELHGYVSLLTTRYRLLGTRPRLHHRRLCHRRLCHRRLSLLRLAVLLRESPASFLRAGHVRVDVDLEYRLL